MKTYNRLDQAEIDRMVYLREHGFSNAQIAKQVGCCRDTVYNKIGPERGKVGVITVERLPQHAPCDNDCPPYTIEYTSKVIRLQRSGAVVTVDKDGNRMIEAGDGVMTFNKDNFKRFVEDLVLAEGL